MHTWSVNSTISGGCRAICFNWAHWSLADYTSIHVWKILLPLNRHLTLIKVVYRGGETGSLSANHLHLHNICMGVLISLLNPGQLSYCESVSIVFLVVSISSLSPSCTLCKQFSRLPFGWPLDSKVSCCSENNGIEKPPITSIACLGESSACQNKSTSTKMLVTRGYCWPFDPVKLSLGSI